jgi:Flp pilus assembly protein TadG
VRDFQNPDEGAVAAFVTLLLVALFALVGLVVDGGVALTAHQAAQVEAEQAARRGAGAVDVDGLRAGTVRIDPVAAVAAAQQFAAASGHPATASVASGVVTVNVQYSVPTVILGIVGIRSLHVTATAAAVNLHGVTTGAP